MAKMVRPSLRDDVQDWRRYADHLETENDRLTRWLRRIEACHSGSTTAAQDLARRAFKGDLP